MSERDLTAIERDRIAEWDRASVGRAERTGEPARAGVAGWVETRLQAAVAHLVEYCRAEGVVVIDCQLPSRHLQSLGSRSISRTQFQGLLREHIAMATVFVQYPRPNV